MIVVRAGIFLLPVRCVQMMCQPQQLLKVGVIMKKAKLREAEQPVSGSEVALNSGLLSSVAHALYFPLW